MTFRGHVPIRLAIASVITLSVHSAQAQSAARAEVPSRGGGVDCTQQCRPVIDECARITAAQGRVAQTAQQAQQAGAACAARIQACISNCSAAKSVAGPPPTGAAPHQPSAPPAYTPSALAAEDFGNTEASARAAYERLRQTWEAMNRQRTQALNHNAQRLVNDVLQVLCRQLSGMTCTTGTGQVALPPLASTSLRGNERFAFTRPPTPPQNDPMPTSPGGRGKGEVDPSAKPSRREGCYLEIEAHVAGGWGSDKLTINTPLQATFYPELRGDKLFITNNSRKPAYVGYSGHPTQEEIPPNSKVAIPFSPIHRSKNDKRDNEADIVVKYWSDDADKCAKEGGGVRPGLTTLEEWGNPYGPGAGDHSVLE